MGKTLTKHFGLDLTYSGYSTYDPTTNPSSIQEYIVAAGRFGHSQINDLFRVLLGDKTSYSYLLRDNFFEPTAVSLGHVSNEINKAQHKKHDMNLKTIFSIVWWYT
jgi:hypothetical protein